MPPLRTHATYVRADVWASDTVTVHEIWMTLLRHVIRKATLCLGLPSILGCRKAIPFRLARRSTSHDLTLLFGERMADTVAFPHLLAVSVATRPDMCSFQAGPIHCEIVWRADTPASGSAKDVTGIKYGVAPPGARSTIGPAPLQPGCYEVFVTGESGAVVSTGFFRVERTGEVGPGHR